MVKIKPLGDQAITIQIAEAITEENRLTILQLMHEIEKNPFVGFVEAVPAYINLTVYYDPIIVRKHSNSQTAYDTVSSYIHTYMKQLSGAEIVASREIEIPIIYGGKYGPDLTYVANYHGISEKEVIRLHSEREYLVHMIGFVPGFPFLGGMNKAIAAPRKKVPRQMVPGGSVGIAGNQTGIYPIDTPGGWQIIGQTPLQLYLQAEAIPSLIRAGDKLKFVPIEENTFNLYMEKEGVFRWQLK